VLLKWKAETYLRVASFIVIHCNNTNDIAETEIEYRYATIRYPLGVRINSEKCLLASSCLAVRLSAFIGSAPTGRIFMRFDIGDFYGNQSISRFG